MLSFAPVCLPRDFLAEVEAELEPARRALRDSVEEWAALEELRQRTTAVSRTLRRAASVVLEELEFRILGPLEVVHQGRLLTVTGERQRALLAVLVLHANEVVSADRLLEEVFGDSTPATAQNTLQAAVSRLRKTLGRPDVILTRPRGYVLQVEPGRVDHRRFEQLVEEGRRALERGDADVAARLLESALEQWRGRPLADVDVGSGAAGDVARLDELRLTALMDRIDADLALGRSSQLVGELEALAREHPYQERLRGQLMLALYRSGRQAEALDVYTETRKL